jgi:hypothetical protein
MGFPVNMLIIKEMEENGGRYLTKSRSKSCVITRTREKRIDVIKIRGSLIILFKELGEILLIGEIVKGSL